MSELLLKIQYQGDNGFALNLNCELPANGVTAVYGPSGSGKSSLLDCIAGLRHPTSDSIIRLGNSTWHGSGHAVPVWQRGIGYVFQDARLFPHLNVQQNLEYPLTRHPLPATTPLDQAVTWLELAELLPDVGWRSPAIQSSSELLPLPLGP